MLLFVFANCLLGTVVVMLCLCCESSLERLAVVIFVLQIIFVRRSGDAMFYCKSSLEEVVVLLFVFANCLLGKVVVMLCLCCESSLERSAVVIFVLRIIFGRRGDDVMFYRELSLEEVAALYFVFANCLW